MDAPQPGWVPPEPEDHQVTAPPSGMDLAVSFPDPHIAVVTVVGEVDESSCPRLTVVLEQCARGQHTAVVLDATAVDFLGVVGLDLLANIRARVSTGGPRLVVAASRQVRHALRVSGLDTLLDCHTSAREALAAEGAVPLPREDHGRTRVPSPEDELSDRPVGTQDGRTSGER